MTVSGSADSIVMVEGGALEISEAEMLEALKVAHKGIKELLGHRRRSSSTKAARPKHGVGQGRSRRRRWSSGSKALAEDAMAKAINAKDKAARAAGAEALKAKVKEQLAGGVPRGGAADHRPCSRTSSTG